MPKLPENSSLYESSSSDDDETCTPTEVSSSYGASTESAVHKQKVKKSSTSAGGGFFGGIASIFGDFATNIFKAVLSAFGQKSSNKHEGSTRSSVTVVTELEESESNFTYSDKEGSDDDSTADAKSEKKYHKKRDKKDDKRDDKKGEKKGGKKVKKRFESKTELKHLRSDHSLTLNPGPKPFQASAPSLGQKLVHNIAIKAEHTQEHHHPYEHEHTSDQKDGLKGDKDGDVKPDSKKTKADKKEDEDEKKTHIIVGPYQICWKTSEETICWERDCRKCTVLEVEWQPLEKKPLTMKRIIPLSKPLGTTIYRQPARSIFVGPFSVKGYVKIVLNYLKKMGFVQIMSSETMIYNIFSVSEMIFLPTESPGGAIFVAEQYLYATSNPLDTMSTNDSQTTFLSEDSVEAERFDNAPEGDPTLVQIVFTDPTQGQRFREVVDTLNSALNSHIPLMSSCDLKLDLSRILHLVPSLAAPTNKICEIVRDAHGQRKIPECFIVPIPPPLKPKIKRRSSKNKEVKEFDLPRKMYSVVEVIKEQVPQFVEEAHMEAPNVVIEEYEDEVENEYVEKEETSKDGKEKKKKKETRKPKKGKKPKDPIWVKDKKKTDSFSTISSLSSLASILKTTKQEKGKPFVWRRKMIPTQRKSRLSRKSFASTSQPSSISSSKRSASLDTKHSSGLSVAQSDDISDSIQPSSVGSPRTPVISARSVLKKEKPSSSKGQEKDNKIVKRKKQQQPASSKEQETVLQIVKHNYEKQPSSLSSSEKKQQLSNSSSFQARKKKKGINKL